DVTLALEVADLDDVHRFVEHDLLATPQVVGLDRRRHRDAQLAPAGEDVDRSVLVRTEEVAVSGRRLGEPVDLFLERDDLLARFLLQSRGTSLGIVTSGHAPTSSRRSHAHYEPISASHAWGAEPPQHFSPPSAHLDVNLWPDVADGVAPAPPGPVAGS